MYKILFFCGAWLVCTACLQAPDISNQDFDKISWKKDKNACSGLRSEIGEHLEKLKPRLFGLSEMELTQILGKPDKHELYERGQKFYIYYIDPSPSQCQNAKPSPRIVQFRFNALNQINEVIFSREP